MTPLCYRKDLCESCVQCVYNEHNNACFTSLHFHKTKVSYNFNSTPKAIAFFIIATHFSQLKHIFSYFGNGIILSIRHNATIKLMCACILRSNHKSFDHTPKTPAVL